MKTEEEIVTSRGSRASLLGGSTPGGSGRLLAKESDNDSGRGRLLGTLLGSSSGPPPVPGKDGKRGKRGDSTILKPEFIGAEISALRTPITEDNFVPPVLLGYDVVAYFGIKVILFCVLMCDLIT